MSKKEKNGTVYSETSGTGAFEARRILQNKGYLYLTEFFAGMSLMAVEIGAQRLISPYFSSSQIVWTIIIGTIMIAMALGNVYGGRSADKDPNPDRLYRRILIAAIWLALIPVFGKYLIIGISAVLIFSVDSNFLIIAAFAVCMIVFVFPLFLLGTVTPSLAKYTMGSLNDNGKIVGTLGASNTIGSILGTFLPTFVTIPAVGTSVTFLIFAGILIGLSMVYFCSVGFAGHRKKVIAGLALFLVACIFGNSSHFAFWETTDDLLYEGESAYNYLQVRDEPDQVILSTNVLFGVQSVLKKERGLTGMYYDYAMAAPFMAGVHEKDSLDVLILGMGSGTYATQCGRYFDHLKIEGVEIDRRITELAGKYFELPSTAKVTTYDGRAYLDVQDRKFDVIMVDAYQDITIPFQMSSLEFFTSVREHLRDDGVMVVNMNMRGNEKGSINEYLADTIAEVFPSMYTVDVAYSTNRELFASPNDRFMEVFRRNVALEKQRDLRKMMEAVSGKLSFYQSSGYLLTDDKAPVELLGMRDIDSIIQKETGYYRKIYEEEGIKGLIRALQ